MKGKGETMPPTEPKPLMTKDERKRWRSACTDIINFYKSQRDVISPIYHTAGAFLNALSDIERLEQQVRPAKTAVQLLRSCEKKRDALRNSLSEVMKIAGHHVGTRLQIEADKALSDE